MKFSLYTKQIGFSRLYFHGSLITTFCDFCVSFYVIRVLLHTGREDLSYYFQRQKDRLGLPNSVSQTCIDWNYRVLGKVMAPRVKVNTSKIIRLLPTKIKQSSANTLQRMVSQLQFVISNRINSSQA